MSAPDLLSLPEGKTLEFKRDLSSLKPILRTLVAFANTAGGTLVIGRAEDGAVLGLPDVFAAERRLVSAVFDSISPPMTPEIEIFTHEGKDLLVVKVAHWHGPFYLKAEGPERGVYIRLGSTNRPAGPEILEELRRSLSGLSFDRLPCSEGTPADLDMKKIRAAFAESGRRVSEQKLESLGLLVPYGGRHVPSNGGVILFGREAIRARFFPDANVGCARFQGTDKVEFLDRLDLEGTPLDALEAVPNFIRRNTRLAGRIEGMRRRDIPEYPPVTVREVLLNALVHADYSRKGMRILVAIYDDRMEIQSPGMLPFGMTLDDFKAGVSRIRNQVIARVFRDLGLIEQWGGGYRRILDDCKRGGYPEPEWVELGSAVRVVVKPRPDIGSGPGRRSDETVFETIHDTVNETLNKRQKWFVHEIEEGRQPHAPSIIKRFRCSRATAMRDIAHLIDSGRVEFVGSPKTGRYRLKGPA